MPGQPEVDEQLIARIKEHDRGAMDVLVGRYAGPLFRYARGIAGGDATLAEDALQETFVAVWRHAGSFRGTGSSGARAWLYTITRNAVRHEGKKRGKVQESPDEPTNGEVSLEAAGFGSTSTSFEQAIESKERVHKALAGLLDHEREVVLLVDVSGLSVEEAAGALELSLAATKSRLHRARLRLMALLSSEDGP